MRSSNNQARTFNDIYGIFISFFLWTSLTYNLNVQLTAYEAGSLGTNDDEENDAEDEFFYRV